MWWESSRLEPSHEPEAPVNARHRAWCIRWRQRRSTRRRCRSGRCRSGTPVGRCEQGSGTRRHRWIPGADRALEGLHAHEPVRRNADARLRRLARASGGDGEFFKSGTLDQEVVATYASGDLVVLVAIERVRAEVGGLPEQDWSLRVTQVFRRDGTGWQLVHRHADPLVRGITVEQAVALVRGEKR